MANEAMTEERWKEMEKYRHFATEATLREYVADLLAAYREAEQTGYRRGVDAAMDILGRSVNFTDAGREVERAAFLTSIEQVRFLLSSPIEPVQEGIPTTEGE